MSGPRRFTLFPPVIKTLLISNVIIFILTYKGLLGGLFFHGVQIGDLAEEYFALWPFEGGHFYLWQLITYQFMHGGYTHIFFNLFALWMFGVELETLWGTRRFTLYYLLCGIGAGVLHILVTSLLLPANFTPYDLHATVGASGSIFGVLLAFGLTFPERQIIVFPFFFPIQARIFVLLFAALELISGLSDPNSSVAHFAHLGGALVGFLLLKFGDKLGIYSFFDKVMGLFGRIRRSTSFSSTRRIHEVPQQSSQTPPPWFRTSPPVGSQSKSGGRLFEPTKEISQEEIDRILDKISKHGYNSLNDQEKHILYEASKKS